MRILRYLNQHPKLIFGICYLLGIGASILALFHPPLSNPALIDSSHWAGLELAVCSYAWKGIRWFMSPARIQLDTENPLELESMAGERAGFRLRHALHLD